ncbi:MAG TPA: hypothetical protein VKB19_02240 [Pedobacter sp.]|nr:hypothetical protein [Pedobacter sp.]
MKRFLTSAICLSIPFLTWAIVNVIVDPFNYFNIGIFSKDTRASAEGLNQLMYRTIDYVHEPCGNILIGDSRTELLPIKRIEKLTGEKYKKLNTNGTKLNEIFDLFYLAHKREKLKKVVIGVNFNMFNKFGYQDRISGLQRVLDNPLIYIYNKDVAYATYVTIKYLVTKVNVDQKPPMTKEEFWKFTILSKAIDWYGKYEFPAELNKELVEFDNFTHKNNIEVVFIIVPHSNDFHNRLVQFGLSDQERRFKKIMSNLNATVYDFDYRNPITLQKTNFKDPIHYNDSIGNLMVDEIWNHKLSIGKRISTSKD